MLGWRVQSELPMLLSFSAHAHKVGHSSQPFCSRQTDITYFTDSACCCMDPSSYIFLVIYIPHRNTVLVQYINIQLLNIFQKMFFQRSVFSADKN